MITTYESAEKFLEKNPDAKEMMQVNLISFETGFTEAILFIVEEIQRGHKVNAELLLGLVHDSAKRVELLKAGNLRPDLEIAPR